MVVSQRRIEANRRNSARSSGPRDTSRSRLNALVHGLCSSTVVAEDAQHVSTRNNEFFHTLRPQNDFHCWLVTEVSLHTVKIERAERMDRRARDKIAIKAELTWDDDKRLEAELLGEQLGKRPAVVVEQLRRTPQGCEWMMERWAMLARAYDVKQEWTAEQKQLAFDLLATPEGFRAGHEPGESIDFLGRPTGDKMDPAEVARREITLLMGRLEDVSKLDEANRALAMADLYDDTDAELKRIRKYEGTLHSRLRWCLRQLQQEAPVREVPRWLKLKWLGSPMPTDAPAGTAPQPLLNTALEETRAVKEAARLAEAAPEPAPEPALEPEAELAMVEDAEADVEAEVEARPTPSPADFDLSLTDRRLKAIQRAEERREAGRRKLERRRA